MIYTNIKKLCIILQHSSYEKWHLAATLAATTTAMNGEAHLFLSHEALLAYVEDKIDQAKPQFENPELNQNYLDFMEDGKIPTISFLLKKAQELGTVKFYGCSESAQLFRLNSDLKKKLDAVIGYTMFLDIASDGRLLTI